MLAGERDAVASIQPLLAPLCRKTVDCGPTPNALIMKFAANLFMICMVTGLAEAMYFAHRHGAELATLVTNFDASPMASDVPGSKPRRSLPRK
jgi:3-hydroxyisobutyrate dehydrogenase